MQKQNKSGSTAQAAVAIGKKTNCVRHTRNSNMLVNGIREGKVCEPSTEPAPVQRPNQSSTVAVLAHHQIGKGGQKTKAAAQHAYIIQQALNAQIPFPIIGAGGGTEGEATAGAIQSQCQGGQGGQQINAPGKSEGVIGTNQSKETQIPNEPNVGGQDGDAVVTSG